MNNIFGLLQVCYRPGDLEKQYVSYLLKAAEQKSDPQQQHIIVDQVELIRCLDEQATENILVQYLHAIADRVWMKAYLCLSMRNDCIIMSFHSPGTRQDE
eukprot:TRINITY_DN3532_c0_g1_i4.p1 TRINITY_DN3532_c0_g1~~TRINITY_DN3532_c0_g1_i4.p1  ORF type:complete len:100 (-),score=12.46 TRINITY_DN3532_c0_g1_i4:42-341(-)